MSEFFKILYWWKTEWIWKNNLEKLVYEGEWKDDKRDGEGKFIWANGEIYEGEFKDDVRNDQGK